MDLGLEGSIAVVTGASKGIGLAIVKAMVAEGAYVVAGARKRSGCLDALVDEGNASFVEVDLAVPDGPAARCLRRWRDISASTYSSTTWRAATRTEGFLSVTDDQWLSSITLNLMAAVRTTRAALVPMLDAGKGSIVTTSSVNAFLPDPAVIDYGAARPPCPTSAKRSRRSSARAGSAATPSVRDPSPRTCGSAPQALPRLSRGPPARTRRPSRPARRPPASQAGLRSRQRLVAWWLSLRVTPLPTSPAQTSRSTADSSRPSDTTPHRSDCMSDELASPTPWRRALTGMRPVSRSSSLASLPHGVQQYLRRLRRPTAAHDRPRARRVLWTDGVGSRGRRTPQGRVRHRHSGPWSARRQQRRHDRAVHPRRDRRAEDPRRTLLRWLRGLERLGRPL